MQGHFADLELRRDKQRCEGRTEQAEGRHQRQVVPLPPLQTENREADKVGQE